MSKSSFPVQLPIPSHLYSKSRRLEHLMTNVTLSHLGLSHLGRHLSLLLLQSHFLVNNNFLRHLESCKVKERSKLDSATCFNKGVTAFCVCLPFMSICPLACSLKCSCSSSLVAIFISHITHLWPSGCKGSLLSEPCAPVPVTVPLIFTPLPHFWKGNPTPAGNLIYSSLANIETVASVAAASKAAPSDGDTWHLAHTTGAIWRGDDLMCICQCYLKNW